MTISGRLGLGFILGGVIAKIVDDGSPNGSMFLFIGGILWMLFFLGLLNNNFRDSIAIPNNPGHYLGALMACLIIVASAFRCGKDLSAPKGVHLHPVTSDISVMYPWSTAFHDNIDPKEGVIPFVAKGLLRSSDEVKIYGHMEYQVTKKNGGVLFRHSQIERMIQEAVELALPASQIPELNKVNLETGTLVFLRLLLDKEGYKVKIKLGISLVQSDPDRL